MDLTNALGAGPGDVVAFVGGGGKTSALYRLGYELARRDIPVVLGGTTRFTPPESGAAPNLILIDPSDRPDALPAAGPWPLTVATGHGNKGRLLPVTPEWVDALHRLCPDWALVVEADGSAMRPFKAPDAHEPVIPASTTIVVVVVGIDVAGRALDDTHVHRHQLAGMLAGAREGTLVDEDLIAAVLTHAGGGRKGTPSGARWIPLINKADTPARLARAEALAQRLQPSADRVIISALRSDPPVVRWLPGGSG